MFELISRLCEVSCAATQPFQTAVIPLSFSLDSESEPVVEVDWAE